ncbi:Cupin-like domain family protein [Leishmania donovani]|uniref:Cupin-like domain family protein n=1 Tax=Leishmania donovani TaxID=5661 RepID=A0A504WZ60_LEIDO|nr:Cupin-like domain family protein [Leishmania donovani]TPP52009.1 Cupin-like domain family protein [Leishmania donovani]
MPTSAVSSATSCGCPLTLLEAFASSAAALRQFGIPRVRVVGLSEGCTQQDYERQRARPDGKDLETLLQESSLRGPHGRLGTASRRTQNEQSSLHEATAYQNVPVVTEQEFMSKFVFHSRPCVILDALEAWPALRKWRDDCYVFDLDHTVMRPKNVTVALTPNGRADSVTRVTYATAAVPAEEAARVYAGDEACKQAVLLSPLTHAADTDGGGAIRQEKIFMYAAELRVTLPQLYGLLLRSPMRSPPHPIDIDMRTYADKQRTPAIAYAQLQNNCLNTEYTHLRVDLLPNVERFGCRVFSKEAVEAANVWIGIPASVSSMHQDWVENLYSVVRGVKEFVLIPPWEGPFVPKPEIPAAAFAIDEAASLIDPEDDRAESWSLQFKQYPVKDGTVVPWMDFDLAGADAEVDAEGAARAELEGRLLEKLRVSTSPSPSLLSSAEAKRASNDEDAAAAREEAGRKPLHPLVVYVHPGETLYLPAMWLHRVAQHPDSTDLHARQRHSGSANAAASASPPPLPLTAAVNYWYDMSFSNPSVVLLREFGLLL